MSKIKRQKSKIDNGITLIALVITIIVLLILAGVTIATLTGENGILAKASEASEKTELADEKEKEELTAIGALAKADGDEVIQENLEKELGEYFTDGKYIVEPGTNEEGTEGYIVTITENYDNGRSYFVDKMGNVTEYTIREPEKTPEVSKEPAFTRANGLIEIEFLTGTSYDIATTPNEPKMTSDMKKVYWEEDGTEIEEGEAEFDENNWYQYTVQAGTTASGGTSHWANAKTKDGSYWVWIPRYAYRIIYFDTPEHKEAYRADNTKTEGIVGYSDARGIVNIEGKTPSDLGEPVTGVAVGKNKLRVHPVFENGTLTGFSQGEWDSKLEGIWVAKYEVSQSGTTIKSIPGVTSYRSTTIGTMYTKGYDYDRDKESHMMKNSEWGVVAYLTESKYGRNGTAITKNSSSGYYTGGASGATPSKNKLQSTTGNEYGIYDMVGGAYEYIASYVADSTQTYGNSFASIDNKTNNKQESTKYATVYQMATSNSSTDNYHVNINRIFGDATTETSTSESETGSWYSVLSRFVGIKDGDAFPFFQRGGYYKNTNVGLFTFATTAGYNGSPSGNGFRICLTIR